MTHSLNLASEPFEAIKNGFKIIESRLFDEKRQKIDLEDEIVFTNRDANESITVIVVGLHRYRTFDDMFNSMDYKKFGGDSVSFLSNQINQFYSLQDQEKLGVIGIEFKIQTL